MSERPQAFTAITRRFDRPTRRETWGRSNQEGQKSEPGTGRPCSRIRRLRRLRCFLLSFPLGLGFLRSLPRLPMFFLLRGVGSTTAETFSAGSVEGLSSTTIVGREALGVVEGRGGGGGMRRPLGLRVSGVH